MTYKRYKLKNSIKFKHILNVLANHYKYPTNLVFNPSFGTFFYFIFYQLQKATFANLCNEKVTRYYWAIPNGKENEKVLNGFNLFPI